jgi:hypothetical protein
MDSHNLDELWRRKKLQTVRLMEVNDLTRQLLQAAERRDQVSVSMILAMREDPVQRLGEMEASLQAYVNALPQEDAIRAAELLDGAEASGADEARLCEQVAQYRRLLESTLEMDRRLSLRMGGNRSFYKMFRT